MLSMSLPGAGADNARGIGLSRLGSGGAGAWAYGQYVLMKYLLELTPRPRLRDPGVPEPVVDLVLLV